MATDSWDLAVAELVFYIPTTIPTLYCLWKHRHGGGLLGWLFLLAFVGLQLIGAGITLGAGQHGTASTTAAIITNVGLSPLILGVAGIVHEWAKLGGSFRTKQAEKHAWIAVLLFHILVMGAIAIYAVGASESYTPSTASHGKHLWRAGVLLLLLLWVALCTAFGILAFRIGTYVVRPLFWATVMSLFLLGVRIIYQCAATFDDTNPSSSSIALRIIFGFIPGALILLAMIIGGVMVDGRAPREGEIKHDDGHILPQEQGIPISHLTDRGLTQ